MRQHQVLMELYQLKASIALKMMNKVLIQVSIQKTLMLQSLR